MTCFRQLLRGLAPLVLSHPLLWGGPEGAAAAGFEGLPGMRVLSREDIVNSGARDLADLLATLPGIRIAQDRSRSFPASGPLVSSDAGTQLSAGQMSRILILFKGHSLNKAWFGGADQDWSTGFLEGLKEVRVYTGPAASYRNGTAGAVDMVVDLIPFEGADQKGGVDVRLSQSLNADRFDKSLFHARGGDRWGSDGQYAWFGDVTRWGGEDVRQAGSDFVKGDRMDRKDPSWQVGGLVQKGDFELMARHLQHDYFDTAFCGRRWGYSFIEGTQALELPDGWRMKVALGGDHIVSKWGLASSATTQTQANWDQVKESRASLRVEAQYEVAETSIQVSLDARNAWLRGGPDQGPADQSVMNMSVRRGEGGAAVAVLERINPSLSLEGGLRLERVSGFTNIGALPSVSTLYREGRTEGGIRYAEGLRYMDLWYRFGSGTSGASFVPYVEGQELKPERNQQLSLWWKRRLGGPWSVEWNGAIGKYSHLMGFDWDFAEAQGFNQVRAASVGGYRYWDTSGSLRYETRVFDADASLSYQRSYDVRLTPRQLYATPGGDALYLPPLVGSIGVVWRPSSGLVFSGRYRTFSRSRNAGMDLGAGGTFNPSYNQGPYADLPSGSTLDLSLRALELWKHTELQVTVHNALNTHERQALVEGGHFFTRGRELNLIARRRF